MTMGSLESETLIEAEKIKAKAAIAVAVLNNASSSIIGLNESSRENLLEYIKKVQQTVD